MGSWMEPAYERVKETTGRKWKIHFKCVKPIIMERHRKSCGSDKRTAHYNDSCESASCRNANHIPRNVDLLYRKKVAYKRRAVAYRPRARATRIAHRIRRSPSNLIPQSKPFAKSNNQL